MTPYFDEDKFQPLSSITCAALYDLGYEVNFDAADKPWVRDGQFASMTTNRITPSTSFILNQERMKRPGLLSLSA